MSPVTRRHSAIAQRARARHVRSSWASGLLTALHLCLVAACTPPLDSDAILVIDPGMLTKGGDGRLMRVDPSNGRRTLLSDFSDMGQGALGIDPFAMADEGSGTFIVVDLNGGTGLRGALFRVDKGGAARTLVSDFGDPIQGPLGVDPLAVAIEPTGDLLVVDPNARREGHGLLWRVNPKSGRRNVLSDLVDPAQGSQIGRPGGVAVEPAGTILLVSPDWGVEARGALWRISPKTGSRTLLSDFGNAGQGDLGMDPFAIAVPASGAILIFDPGAGREAKGALFQVDPRSGVRALISDFGDPGQGPQGVERRSPFLGMAVESSGAILVIDPKAGEDSKGLLFRIDPRSGDREVLSVFGQGAQGPLGLNPSGVVVIRALREAIE